MTAARIGCPIEPIGGAAQAQRIGRCGGELMLLQRRLAALFAVLVLTGCAQGITGQAPAPNAPNSRGTTRLGPSTAEAMAAAVAGVCSRRGALHRRLSRGRGTP
jgi:hypothetical protein